MNNEKTKWRKYPKTKPVLCDKVFIKSVFDDGVSYELCDYNYKEDEFSNSHSRQLEKEYIVGWIYLDNLLKLING